VSFFQIIPILSRNSNNKCRFDAL